MTPSPKIPFLLPVIAGLVLALFLVPASADAQSVRLDQVEGYTNDGRVAEARATLESWWDQERAGASRTELQRALWLRGVLTLDPEVAESDYQRLVTEFPGGPFSDRALMRLAQSAHVDDDLARAAEHYRHLVRDYPGSALRGEADAWLTRHASEPGVSRGAAGARVSPPPAAGRDATQTDPAATPGARQATPPPAQAAGERHAFAIQLGAFQNEDGAQRLIEEAAAAGLEVRVVRTPGSDLVRVRTGNFATRDDLAPVLARIRGLGFDGFLVADAASEIPFSF